MNKKWINQKWADIVALARNPDTNIESRFRAYEKLLGAMDWGGNILSTDISRLLDLREIRADLYGLDQSDKQRSVRMYEQYCPYKDKEFCAP